MGQTTKKTMTPQRREAISTPKGKWGFSKTLNPNREDMSTHGKSAKGQSKGTRKGEY
jgi:hypothetical protein